MAFALESVLVEPTGWGITCVLLSLWMGRFLGFFGHRRWGSTHDPISVMIWADVPRVAAQFGLLAYLYAFDNGIAAMSVSSFVYGAATSFFMPARFVSMPYMVRASLLKEANAWLAMTENVYAIAGPLVGSAVVASLGFKSVLWFDGITFLASLVFLLCLKKRVVPQNASSGDAVGHMAGEGPPENASMPVRRWPLWVVSGLASWFFCFLLIGFLGAARPTWVLGAHAPVALAVLTTGVAVGSLMGSATSLLSRVHQKRWAVVHGISSLGLALQLYVLTLPIAIWVPCGVGFVASFFTMVSEIRWNTTAQHRFCDKDLHRFASLDQCVHTAGIPLGMLLFGVSSTLGWTDVVVPILALVTSGFGIVPLFFRKS